jgi:hypothetical protein
MGPVKIFGMILCQIRKCAEDALNDAGLLLFHDDLFEQPFAHVAVLAAKQVVVENEMIPSCSTKIQVEGIYAASREFLSSDFERNTTLFQQAECLESVLLGAGDEVAHADALSGQSVAGIFGDDTCGSSDSCTYSHVFGKACFQIEAYHHPT